MTKIGLLISVGVCLILNPCFGQPNNQDSFRHYGINPRYNWISCEPVQQKNFYLLTVFERDPVLKHRISKDKVLRSILSRYLRSLSLWDVNCGNIPACYTEAMLWDSISVAQAAERLEELYAKDVVFRMSLHIHLQESGAFIKWQGMAENKILTMALAQEMACINQIITNYTTNRGFRYPDIDSDFYDVRSAEFRKVVTRLFEHYSMVPDTSFLFFSPSMKLALDVLKAAHRDEAARHEPLYKVNKAAFDRIAHTEWNKYPFSAILIFGEGPNDKKNISAGGMLRCDAGAELYQKGKAPFIVVSGGYVHPFQTRWCEAIEMRKYLIDQYHIPAKAIIVEPHARHTTTNIRNTARIIFRNGIPAGKKVLGISSSNHISYMMSPIFTWRNNNDLGYLPYADMQKNSDNTVEFYPVAKALFWDGSDPLDP
jgi:DUF218 domain-containing protein